MQIEAHIKESKKILMQYWPLQSFIATNPLWSFIDKNFLDTLKNSHFSGLMDIDYYKLQYQDKKITATDIKSALSLVEKKALNEDELREWITKALKQPKIKRARRNLLYAQQLTEYQFQNPVVRIKEHIFTTLRDYFGLNKNKSISLIDYWINQNHFSKIDNIEILQQASNATIAKLLLKMGIQTESITDYLQEIFIQVYGWASFINWSVHQPDNPWINGNYIPETLLVMWLYYEYRMYQDTCISYQENSSPNKHNIKNLYIWQTAFEINYLNQLDHLLKQDRPQHKKTYDAQFIFCIDTRSEGMRRHLEAQGNYQTFGFAGFFGAIFKLDKHGYISYQSPALITPTQTVVENTPPNLITKIKNQFSKTVKSSKKQLFSAYALFEMIGFWFFIFMLYKLIRPYTPFLVKHQAQSFDNKLSIDNQVSAAHTLLLSIGLTNNFSKQVFICAHQTDNVNNPFKSALNCGACGGNSGIPNAIIMADILNNSDVRAALQNKHIDIPSDTLFIPLCHHTTYDRLEVLKHQVSNQLKKDFDSASQQLRAEKIKSLPGQNTLSQREEDWSELIPELGLINNAAMIIGPRDLTMHTNLERRVFLHSYDPTQDNDAAILTSILSAPAIVAHWISAQYYFSTVDPKLFGAGNKAIHNVLPGVGVLEGNLSDLKVGLSTQSVYFRTSAIHEPRRMIIVVYAHQQILDKAIANSPNFKHLLDNNWIHLKHIEATSIC